HPVRSGGGGGCSSELTEAKHGVGCAAGEWTQGGSRDRIRCGHAAATAQRTGEGVKHVRIRSCHTDLFGRRSYGHAQRLRGAVWAGTGSVVMRAAEWPCFRFL